MARVISGWRGYLSPRDRAAVKAGDAVLGPADRGPSVASACVACTPGWQEANRLALQDYEWQLAKEEAIAAADFDTARAIRDRQYELRPAFEALARRLCGWA